MFRPACRHSLCRLFGEVQLRFARDGSTPIRDQLATQLMLEIASGGLGPGKGLPSTRGLAKGFRVNANNFSAAYRQLELLGWVDSVRGSGVYVRMHERSPAFEMESLDRVTVPFLRALRAAGFLADAIRNRIDYWLAKRPKRFVFVHPEAELQAIIVHELKQEMSSEVEACDAEPAKITEYVGDSIFLTVPSKERVIRGLLPAASELLTLQFRHVDDALAQYLPIPSMRAPPTSVLERRSGRLSAPASPIPEHGRTASPESPRRWIAHSVSRFAPSPRKRRRTAAPMPIPFSRWPSSGSWLPIDRILTGSIAQNVCCGGGRYAAHAALASTPPPVQRVHQDQQWPVGSTFHRIARRGRAIAIHHPEGEPDGQCRLAQLPIPDGERQHIGPRAERTRCVDELEARGSGHPRPGARRRGGPDPAERHVSPPPRARRRHRHHLRRRVGHGSTLSRSTLSFIQARKVSRSREISSQAM